MRMLTFDTDWCENWMVEDIVSVLLKTGIRATFFVTNEMPALRILRVHPDQFELGIHPNFMVGSTHGQSEDEVLLHCKTMIPEAVSMRSHGLYQSSNILIKAYAMGIRNDESNFMPEAEKLSPYTFRFGSCRMKRLPYNWEDDYFMDDAAHDWSSLPTEDDVVYDFHPVHIALNSSGLAAYRELKEAKTVFSREVVDRYRGRTVGTGDFFRLLIRNMAASGDVGMTVSQKMAKERL